MGKNNRGRRAAKQKQRERSRADHRRDGARRTHRTGPNTSEPFFDQDELIAGLIDLAPARLRLGDQRFVDDAITSLVRFPSHEVHNAIAAELRRTVTALWNGGWQPVEVVRQARRTSAAAASLLVAAVAADHAASRSSTIDERWAGQLAEMELPTIDDPNTEPWVRNWVESAGLDLATALAMTFELLVVLRSLPHLEQLIAPPGAPTLDPSRMSRASAADRAALDKVRSLLVKAESTTFEAEAEAFTAKAHELMTRHAIDSALLEADAAEPTDTPITVRIAIDDPYVDAKSLLLQEVAQATRCRTVFHDGLALSTVVGFAADVAATEMLYTSLLVQAQSALAAEARRAVAGSRNRSRSYRATFLLSFATRIGQRLEAINESLVSEASATAGRSILPALRSRQDVVDEAIAARFSSMKSSSVRGGSDAAGWAHGRLAADQAQLNFAEFDGPTDAAG